ncbi:hypothetical protein NT6N_23040 [Oceaniferula spumae]|uniref:Xylose isomerase-like TIM barrel domain-containing protein n=1 Tax=Oceaniferula spumae TaxID=2979115 RepID=A0AAT9FMY0_9BACT
MQNVVNAAEDQGGILCKTFAGEARIAVLMNSTHQHSRRQFLKSASVSAMAWMGAGKLFGAESDQPWLTDYGVCTSYKNFAMLKQHGYGYIEDSVGRLLKPDRPDSEVADDFAKIRNQNIRVHACNSFIPKTLKSVGSKANHEAVLKHADITFQRAKQIGIKGIVFGSSGSRSIPDGFDRKTAEAQFVALLKKMAPLAQAQGVEVWLEPLRKKETNFINTQLEGAAIIDQVGHPSLGMVCDFYHAACNGETPDEILKAGKHIRHCHIAEKEKRTAPGMKGDDFTPYLSALKKSGYRGTMSMECGWKNMEKQATEVREYLEKQATKA